jgi:hypothetical protein
MSVLPVAICADDEYFFGFADFFSYLVRIEDPDRPGWILVKPGVHIFK